MFKKSTLLHESALVFSSLISRKQDLHGEIILRKSRNFTGSHTFGQVAILLLLLASKAFL
ncbi:hypothetical protein M2145_002039 [Lachnospiraceae bacterium PF1-21]